MAENYSSFAFYRGEFGGKLDEAAYDAFAPRAAAEIDRRCFGRGRGLLGADMGDALARCECELVEVLHGYAQVPFGVESLDNDGLRMAFAGGQEAACAGVCRRWLTRPVNLMYAGGGT